MDVKVDEYGHLADTADWSEPVARALAAARHVELGKDHWRVIAVVRTFHQDTGIAPSMRPLVKLVREQLDPALGSSIALMRLFPASTVRGGTARLVAQIAGLPVPENCL